MKVIKKQTNSKMCLVCGVDNPEGLKASFYEMEDKSLIALFAFKGLHQSYPERVHGGMITAIIDEAIGRAVWIIDPSVWGVTMKIEIEYHHPVPYDAPLRCVARITDFGKVTFAGEAELQDMSGKMLAKGKALYFRLALSKITNDEHIHPNDLDVLVPDDIKEID